MIIFLGKNMSEGKFSLNRNLNIARQLLPKRFSFLEYHKSLLNEDLLLEHRKNSKFVNSKM